MKRKTTEYIQYSLGTVGTKRKVLSDNAIREIFTFSRGNLNLINSICDLALKKGFAYKSKTINTPIVKECGIELGGKVTVDSDVNPLPKHYDEKAKKEKLDAVQPSSPKRWLWIKALFVLLFIFSSYVLFKSQTDNSSIWRTDEPASKNYDSHKLEEEESVSPDTAQGTLKNHSNAESEKQATAPVSPNNENEGPEPSTAGKRNSSNRLPKTNREWPFSTYKKIIYFKYDSNSLSPESLEIR